MVTDEQLDEQLSQCVDAYRAALGACTRIADDRARAEAQRVADSLYGEAVRGNLSPLFKQARKGKKRKKK